MKGRTSSIETALARVRPRRISGWMACFIVCFFLFPACTERSEPIKVDLQERDAPTGGRETTDENVLRFAIGGMITPREGYVYYRRVLDYVGEKIDRPIKIVDREGYAEINSLLQAGKVDGAFVCGGPYVDGREEFSMSLLVAPRSNGETVYYSYIIVPAKSSIRSFDELRGRMFAFTDPLSNSGKLVPTYMLATIGETPETFFGETVYTYAHDKSIKAVSQGLVDGAAVDSLIWEYAARKEPDLTDGTRIIEKSPPYGIPPVVVRPGLDARLVEILRETFLRLHEEERGRAILKGMMIDRFVTIEDSAYDSIREMKEWLKSREREEAVGQAR